MRHERNLAFAQTVPDVERERESFVRVTAGAHPISDQIRRDVELVRQYARDVRAALSSGNPTIINTMPGSLELLAQRLEKSAAKTEAAEDWFARLSEPEAQR